MAGIVTYSGGNVPSGDVERLAEAIRHRGPDHTGTHLEGGLALISTRLSILDLSESAHMPLWTENRDLAIVFNGEIYNFREIRADLERDGLSFRTQGDTEVVLKAYQRYGPECFKRFNGMFALCIHDRRAGKLILARDRFGKKNLYFHAGPERFTFCSEIKGISAIADRAFTVDERAVLEYMAFDHVEHTLFKEVKSLGPGRWLTFDTGTFELREEAYFDLTELLDEDRFQRLARKPYREIEAEAGELLQAAVGRRLISDAPLAVMCSGGVDSSLVTILASRLDPGIQAYLVDVIGQDTGFADNQGNRFKVQLSERHFAEELCQAQGIRLNVFPLTREAYLEEMVKNAFFNDLPPAHLGSSIGVFHLSRMAKENGIKVLLSGEGADELFGGYSPRYRRHLQGNLLRRLFSVTRLLPKRLWDLLGAPHPFLENRLKGISQETFFTLASNSTAKLARYEELKTRYSRMGSPHPDIAALLLSDLDNWLSSILLRNDRAAMEASIETRVPFLDIELVRFAANMPLRHKITLFQDKLILKRLLSRSMGRSFAFRPKNGFAVPVHLSSLNPTRLFRNGFVQGLFGKEILGLATDNPYFISKLMLLEIWHLLFVQQRTIEDVKSMILG